MNNMREVELSATALSETSECTRCVQYDSGADEAAQSTEPYQGDEALAVGEACRAIRITSSPCGIGQLSLRGDLTEQKRNAHRSKTLVKNVIASEAKQSSSNNVTPYLIGGRLSGEGNKSLKTAFSLIELMISLIVVSCITAAFTPVITKKLKTGSLVAGAVSNGLKNLQISPEECKKAIGVNNCTMCDIKKKECISCTSDACDKTHQYTITKDCTCAECSEKYKNCQTCSETACTNCKNGTLLQNDICEDCPDGKICDGTSKTPKDPQSGYYAKDGLEYPCSSAISGCLDCTSTKTGSTTTVLCNKCEAERYLVSNKTKCETCLSTQYCPEGTKEGSIKNCSEQITNCFECTAAKCTKCISTNKLNTNILGSTSCSTCSAGKMCDGTTEEKDCNQNGINDHYCINGIRSTCSSKTEGCTRCNITTGDCTTCTLGTQKLNSSTKKCENCDTGYWCSNGQNKDSNICTSNCATCANSSSCSTCSGNYVKEANGTCTTCPSGYWCSKGVKYPCPAGSWSNGGTNATSKEACNITQPEGQWCTNGSCSSCGNGCKTCASSNTCTTCSSGYYKSSSTCSLCTAGWYCTGDNNRTTCEKGKWSDSGASSAASCTTDKCGSGNWCENGSKTQCSANCSSCASANSCSSSGCTGGMQLDSNGKCSTPSGVCGTGSTSICCSNTEQSLNGWYMIPPNHVGATYQWNRCVTSNGTVYKYMYIPAGRVKGAYCSTNSSSNASCMIVAVGATSTSSGLGVSGMVWDTDAIPSTGYVNHCSCGNCCNYGWFSKPSSMSELGSNNDCGVSNSINCQSFPINY